MADKTFHVSGRGVVELYHDNGDGTHSRVIHDIDSPQVKDINYKISGRAVTIKYHDNNDGTHAEVIYNGASNQAGDRTMEISGRGIKIKYRKMSDGTFAEVVWLGTSNQASDKTYEIPGRGIKIKYRNMGDGTYALVMWSQSSSQSSDRRFEVTGRSVVIKYRDMGDGTFAECIYTSFSPASLFSAGEQGVWYDPSDYGPTGTLFQDSAGTTRVTAVEQAVGLMLDKSKGLVLGSQTELVTNGTFDSTITGWSAQSANVVISWDSGKLKSVTSDTASSYVYQQLTTVVGRWYRVSFAITNGTYRFAVFTDSTLSSVLSTADNGSTLYFLATTTTATIGYRALTATTLYADNISVKEWYLGNHAYQTASTSRPTLRARYNLLTYSEQFDNAAWSKGSTSITQNATTAPNGTTTADTLTEDNTNARHSCAQLAVFAANINLCASIYVKAKERTRYTVGIQGDVNHFVCSTFNLISEQVVSTYTGSLGGTHVSSTITAVGNGWYRCVVIGSVPNATFSAFQSGMAISNTFTPDGSGREVYQGDGTSGIYIWGADLRVANDGVGIPAYQRIAAATDYDTAGFPVYLDFCESFGGTNTDNSMLTNSIDFSGTDKVAVFAGVRKLKDTTFPCVLELSADINANNGTFNVFVTDGNNDGTAAWSTASRGTTTRGAATSNTYSSPITNVLTSLANISGDSVILRANGVQAASNTGDQGTGNYGNYPLYIGRRNNASLPFSGRVYSIVIRGAATSDALIASTETWVNGKTRAFG